GTACTSGPEWRSPAGGPGGRGDGPPTTSQQPAAPPAVLALAPRAGARNVSPTTPVTVRASAGTLDSVRLVHPAGQVVRGTLPPDRRGWQTAEELGYARTYTLPAVASNAEGRRTTSTSSFSTVPPANYTMPSFDALQDGGTFGVGMPITVHFDEPI